MFNKKPRRNFRRRRDESSEEDEQKSHEDLVEDCDAQASAVRKSKSPQSRGLSCSLKLAVEASDSYSSGCEGADEKNGDATDEKPLQRAEKKENRKNNVLSFAGEKEGDNYEFKVKKSSDKEIVFKARRKCGSPGEVTDVKEKKRAVPVQITTSSEDSESGGDGAGEEMHAGSDCDSSSSTSNSSNSSVSKTGAIPDARQIHAARKLRREARAQRDYIPLARERESTPLSVEGEWAEESDDTDDHERQIQFAPKPKTLRERIAEEMGGTGSEGAGSDGQEDEDQILWEEQQIRKGVKRNKHCKNTSSQETVRRRKKCNIPKSLPPVTIDIIKKRVRAKLESLKEVHRARGAEMRRMQLDVDDAQTAAEQLESGSAREQHQFYKGMRVYTQNLLECLTEMVVEINSVELEMHSLLIDQADALLSRRRTTVHEESTRLQQLAYNTDPSSSGHAEEGQAEARGEGQACESEDSNGGGLPADHDPLPEEAAEFCQKRDEILRKAEDIFADVREDFSNVKNILSKFDEWRALFPETYHNAYISLCLPKLLAPLIRHQLVSWSPLNADCQDFEAFPWYPAVEKFCHGQGYEESENTDSKTLTSIIEKTIVTKIQGFVELVWDPLSTEQSGCLVILCRRLQDDYSILDGEWSKPVKAFMDAVIGRMRSSVDEDVFIPLYPKKFLDDARSPQCRFRDEQFYSAVKLLSNILRWDGLVPEDALKELGLDKLLNRYLMMTLLNARSEKDSVERCKKVAACFPKSWFADVDTRSTIPQLQNFSKHLLQTAHALCKKNHETAGTRDIVIDLLILLRNINALDSVTEIVETYRLEGFDRLGFS